MNIVGGRIRDLRKKHNHTLTYLAKRLDFDPAHLSRMETGKKTINIDTLKRVADIYGVEMSYFFGEKQDERISESHIDWIVFGEEMEGKELTPEGVRRIVEFAEQMRNLSKEKS